MMPRSMVLNFSFFLILISIQAQGAVRDDAIFFGVIDSFTETKVTTFKDGSLYQFPKSSVLFSSGRLTEGSVVGIHISDFINSKYKFMKIPCTDCVQRSIDQKFNTIKAVDPKPLQKSR